MLTAKDELDFQPEKTAEKVGTELVKILWCRPNFYGSIRLNFQNGKAVNANVEESVKFE